MGYRHEWKYPINYADILILRMRLNAVMKSDEHYKGNAYNIRSLYFDDLSDKALREKVDGVNERQKFRIRYYNGDTSYIMLEKKSKINGLCLKTGYRLSKEETEKILKLDFDFLKDKESPLCKEFYCKVKYNGLRPKTIVDYRREAFVYKPGNVRVTIDYNIRTGDFRTDFLNPQTITLPAGESVAVLEIKWDEFLPDIIRDAVTVPGRRVSAFSKYERCRIYG